MSELMRNLQILFLSLLLLASCSSRDGGPDTRPLQGDIGGPLAETVNGTPVPQALLEAVARARDLDLTRPDQRAQALTLLTDYVLLAQAARQGNFFSDEKFRADVEAARLQGVGNAALGKLQEQAPITDAVVRAEYESQVARAGKFEYDFSQLLFDNADDALKAAGEIAAGKSFNSVYDAWRGKAKQAKTYSRVRQDQVPPELARTLASLKNGESTRVPVKTDWGWHVVHLAIANPFAPPPFDQVKDSVRQSLLLRVGRDRLQKLKEQAKLEYPPGAVPPAPGKADPGKAAPGGGADRGVDAAEKRTEKP
ncbi:MAG TPA: peptidylprolyl isomerase [Rudaea sp.]|nr:peptidylprolyl isomerase [Rudaea sp.]